MAIAPSHSRRLFGQKEWQLSRAIFTACFTSLIH